MAVKKVTRRKVNNPVVDSALTDVYNKLDKLQPRSTKDNYSNSNLPEEGTMTTVETSDGLTSSAVFTENGWLVDINSNYQRIGTRGFISAFGMKGRSKKPVKGEALSYNNDGNVEIGNSQGDKTLIKNEGGIVKFRNQVDGADASIQCSDVRDANSKVNIEISKTPDAVNNLKVKNSAAGVSGSGPELTVDGTDDNISLKLGAKGLGYVQAIKSSTVTTTSSQIGLKIDYDQTGIVASGQTITGIGLDLDMNCETVTHVGTVNQTGIDLDMVAATDGAQSNIGMDINVSGADKNYGLNITAPDGANDYHIRLFAADDASDYATMSVADTGDLTIATIGDGSLDSKLILDVDGSVEINADAGTIYLKDDDYEFARIKNTLSQGTFYLYPAADANDYFLFSSGDNGAATITTIANPDATTATLKIQAGGTFTVDSGGDIVLDSYSGNFIAKKAGTEFSVANSAYAGMILGYTRIQNDGTVSSQSFIAVNTSSMTVLQTVQGTDLSINFKAPPSGKVEIQCSFWMSATSDGAKFSLSTGTSYAELDETHTYDADQTIYMDETDHYYHTICFSVTGLTAGTDTTYYLAGLASGVGVNIGHGRNRISGTHYPPIILKAIALPATIVTGE